MFETSFIEELSNTYHLDCIDITRMFHEILDSIENVETHNVLTEKVLVRKAIKICRAWIDDPIVPESMLGLSSTIAQFSRAILFFSSLHYRKH